MSEHEPQEQPTQPTPPATAPAWRPDGPTGPRASFGRRLVAYLVDAILLGIVYGVGYAIFGEGGGSLLSLVVGIAYFTYLEGGPKGQTLGKMALGIRVVDFKSGGAIGYGRGVARYIGRLISGVVCLLGYFWMLWDKEKQTWHDKIASSVVVPVEYYPVS